MNKNNSSAGTAADKCTAADNSRSASLAQNGMLPAVPVRIQRSRQHKQVSPNGLPIVYVGRPGKYGNPFKIVGDMIYGDASHRRKILSKWIYIEPNNNDFINWSAPLNEIAVSLYINWLSGSDKNFIIPVPFDNLNELKGKNLSCWCPKNCKCHADVLLELANK